jgi:hypothetical protein
MNLKVDKITLDAELFNDLFAIAKILLAKADGLNPDFLKNSERVMVECERVLDVADYQNNLKIAQHLIDDLAQKKETRP